MKKNKIYISIFFLMTLIGFSGCKDDMMDEITKLEVDRTFSPTGLTANVVNKTNVLLTWKAVNNAKTYTIEVFENADFSGTAVKTIPNITFTQVPYTVTGLAGDTQYSIRVKGVGDGIVDSKWVTATAKTDPEQILQAINAAKLTSNSVALNWPAGQTATTITLSPGNITRAVTAAEIAAGEAIVTGLTGETLYTAKLLNGTKVRGTITFTTLLDLGGAIPVYPTDNFATLIANANAGDVFALFPGTYNINADITATKSISIKGAKPTDKPMIKGMIIRLKANAGLALKDLDIDGTGSLNGNQAVIYDEASDNAYGNLSIENCIIKNYVKGLMYVNVKALIESVTIKGNIISNIECNGGDFIDFRAGLAKTVNFSNNTVYNSALARDFFRMDPAGSTNFPTITSVITIATNTLNGMCTGAANRLLYVRLANQQIFFSKNIVANSGGILTNQASTIIVAANFTGNNYFNAPTYLAGSATSGAKYDTGTSTTLNPGFTAPATGNFTISENTLKTNGIGDPRWR
ncbi:fibronectin type III domain-containing protein [Pedobacter frigiditerrae]|uniref:Fibronectin type III domain-containing protein n=1 Tax=Pedobacter frigiditerrae TaxID=2530452 RepID=A0A4R0MXA0_9SPHI|nr:fibronectin type III domain-containing protein [Pedobacter frigiditerrae]TCC91850.1 fibronectin type III domain-containing protein [Pedobacter frigiditerrae]